jgi:hypothetical protein
MLLRVLYIRLVKLRVTGVALVALVCSTGSGGAEVGRLDVPAQLKVVSYYRADAGWSAFWRDWRPDRVGVDLDRIASLRANTVRAIVQPAAFGYPQVDPVYARRLREFVDLAAARGLHVQLTLFDQWFEWADLRGSQTWAGALLAPYIGDRRIAFVELRNELAPETAPIAWARAMVPFVRGVLRGEAPVTVSVTGDHPVAALLALKRGGVRPDFWDFHVFGGGAELARYVYARAKTAVAPVPVWVGETGYTTTPALSGYGGVPRTPSAQEEAQAHYLAASAAAARSEGLPPVGVWVLDDFLPSALPGAPAGPDDPELHYGLFRLDGSAKPAVRVVRAMFSGGRFGFNNGFERSVVNEAGAVVPAEWSLNGPAVFATDSSVSRNGRASARVVSHGTASLSLTPPSAGCQGRGKVRVGVWARRADASGQVFVVVEWFDRYNQSLRKRRSKLLSAAPGEWQRLRVSSRAPGRAVYATVQLVVDGAKGPVWFDDVSFVPNL